MGSVQIVPIRLSILKCGDDLAAMIANSSVLRLGDIVVVSSKAVATSEGAAVDLSQVAVSQEARDWSAKSGRSPAFCAAVLRETARLRGTVVGCCRGALLTELRPEGLKRGSILAANAGLDESNVAANFAIGWPRDPVASVRRLQSALLRHSVIATPTPPLAVIITDSCCRPRRLGVTAFALASCGIDPLSPQAGKKDLFGKKLRITTEAIADQLATAANFVMGNAGQGIPAVIIRDHDLPCTDFCDWVSGIDPQEDLFAPLLRSSLTLGESRGERQHASPHGSGRCTSDTPSEG